jgi:hypothetical protein
LKFRGFHIYSLLFVLALGLTGVVWDSLASAGTRANQEPGSFKAYASQSPSSSISPDPSSEIDTSNWKTYVNERFGFEFRYPADWTTDGRDISTQEQLYSGNVSVLDIELLAHKGGVQDIVKTMVNAMGCVYGNGEPFENVARATPLGTILYVKNCAALSENYIFYFANSQNQTIRFGYHDDFANNWTGDWKRKLFDQIISTLKLTTASTLSPSQNGVVEPEDHK